MADRGRDLKVGLVSDLSDFDLSGAADQLEDVATGSDQMARQTDKATDELRRLATQGQDAQRELDRLDRGLDDTGDEATQTAKKVDAAFDKIAASSKTNLRDVGKDADRGMTQAGEATETFRDEAKANLSEVASSFTGSMDSAVDVVQGTLGGIVSDLGPLGAAVGAAGAAAVGLIYAKVQEAREAVKELAQSLIDAGGRLGTDDIFSRIGDAAVDDKLKGMIRNAKELGIETSGLAVAFSGSASDIDGYIGALDKLRSGYVDTERQVSGTLDVLDQGGPTLNQLTAGTEANDAAVSALIGTLEGYRDQAEKAEKVQRQFEQITGLSLDTLNNYKAALDEVATSSDDVASATETAAKRQADATKSTEDSWEDYRDTAVASIDDVIAAQERDLEAAANFETNSKKVFEAVGQAGLDWALAQGENADKAMALLADAPKDKQQEVVGNYTELGQRSAQATAAGLASQSGAVAKSAVSVHAKAQEALDALDKLGIKVGIRGEDIPRSARIAWMEADRYFQKHPITIRTRGTGSKPIRDVP